MHSSFQPVPNADIVFPVHFGEGVYQPIYVCKRPGVDDFLNAVCDLFEVVIFTASLATVISISHHYDLLTLTF